MNKYKQLFTIIFFIFFYAAWNSYGQDFDFSVELENPTCRRCKDGSIKVEFQSQNVIDTLMLYTDYPWKNGKLLESKILLENKTGKFTSLKQGDYLVIVKINNEGYKGKYVFLKYNKQK